MKDCLFCKIIAQEVPSFKVYEDESVYAFKDINPSAKEHYLFIAKNHTRNVNDMAIESERDIVSIFKAIAKYTRDSGLEQSGFRVVTNTNKDSGQVVFHTHFHVLGGEKLKGFGA